MSFSHLQQYDDPQPANMAEARSSRGVHEFEQVLTTASCQAASFILPLVPSALSRCTQLKKGGHFAAWFF